jgi:HD-GYP domain-containing protein (c-di-GMP phosphodiesterase class II)
MESDAAIFGVLYRYTKALSVALGYRDPLTRLHSERVLGLAEEIALRCGLPDQELGILRIGAAFHDVGKIGIPDAILLKTSSFDETDWKTMREHCAIGERILKSTEIEGCEQAAYVIRHHHEYYCGRGYPDRLAGEKIPISSRIISIADSYDAMAVTRPYHRAKKHSEVMGILREETGDKHDPQLMRIFCEIIEHSEFKTAEF